MMMIMMMLHVLDTPKGLTVVKGPASSHSLASLALSNVEFPRPLLPWLTRSLMLQPLAEECHPRQTFALA